MTITIVGGERKWYQPVADELGFELIHENGRSPERILSALKRSKAVYMMLEATSHKATWMCKEHAKKYGIPFFRIQGCKSQLKDMILKLG
ncbi:DUF2325 domain-containing protein [Paenibacillus elgii]|uniref:DUF2325 domain-containing protein n=1 Tax=Paenibacillus elgii TaxID=189691 RepID=UPI00203B7123|nr:DUF2325 domain-containing protein [Paenibacillus elgii]MCM3273042.1 DUF2325 domain-containing protein [Paenibacillus elgii]